MTDDDEHAPSSDLSGKAFLERIKRRTQFSGGGGKAERAIKRVILDRDLADKPIKSRSEKSRSAWRNDPGRDEQIYRYINEYLRARLPIRLSTNSGHIVCSSRKILEDAKLIGIRAIPDVFVPHWDHASRLLKMIGWGMASQELGAVPFTLRISPEIFAVASADKVGAARHLQDRLSRHLRYRLPGTTPTFWFAIEKGMGDEPHLHGAVVIPTAREEDVREALCATGGAWASRVRQVKFSERQNLLTWVGYSTKWLFGSMARLGDENLTGASQSMRREARRLYQEARNRSVVIYP